jgi:hypothetical protein
MIEDGERELREIVVFVVVPLRRLAASQPSVLLLLEPQSPCLERRCRRSSSTRLPRC